MIINYQLLPGILCTLHFSLKPIFNFNSIQFFKVFYIISYQRKLIFISKIDKMNSEQNPEECDATDDDSPKDPLDSTKAGLHLHNPSINSR